MRRERDGLKSLIPPQGRRARLTGSENVAVLWWHVELSFLLVFWTYIMLMFLVMLSALLAIVCNAMDAVKEELADRDPGHNPKSVVSEMWELAMHTISDSRRRWRGKQIEEERARFISSWARSLVSRLQCAPLEPPHRSRLNSGQRFNRGLEVVCCRSVRPGRTAARERKSRRRRRRWCAWGCTR